MVKLLTMIIRIIKMKKKMVLKILTTKRSQRPRPHQPKNRRKRNLLPKRRAQRRSK